MAERTKGSLWRRADESAATKFVLRFGFAAWRGATNAGGEDLGYFAPHDAVKNPPSIDRTVESVGCDGCVAGSGEAQKAEPAFRLS
jgi:hypothetical protein